MVRVPGVVTYTETEVIWGYLDNGAQFLWCIDNERIVEILPGEDGKPVWNLLEGNLCNTHGLECAEQVGWTLDVEGAMTWLTGQKPLDAPTVH